LPQGPDRTDMERKHFGVGMEYMHPFTLVLMITQSPSDNQQHTNRRLYHERGWCFFEMRASSIVKDNSCLWDLGKYQGGKTWGDLKKQMRVKRPVPISPEILRNQLEEGVTSERLAFTMGLEDMELVSQLYESGFVQAFETFVGIQSDGNNILDYSNLGWGDEEMPMIKDALAYVQKHCSLSVPLRVHLHGNALGEDSKRQLLMALQDSEKLKIIFDRSP